MHAMRTRFLTTNYFTPSASSSSSSSRAPETLTFLHLPVPHPPPPTLCNFEDILCSSFHSVLSFSLAIDRLPIDAALSRLFSDVLPQIIEGGVAGFTYDERRSSMAGGAEIRSLEKEAEASDEEREVESHRKLGSKILEIEFPGEGNKITIDDGDENKFQIVQFDTPELDMLLENAWLSENEEMQIPLEVPDIENNLDMLKPGLKMQYPHVVLESIYSVEDITVDYPMDQKTYILEDASSIQEQIHCCHSTFPLLEVDETNLGISTTLSVDDELLLHFENIKSHCWTQKEDLMVDGKELLGSMEIMLEYFSDDEPGACEQLFMEHMNVKNFHELIVSHELALVDDTFKALPVPGFADHEKIMSVHAIVEEILAELKSQPLSASDGIYLDWHLLEEDKCNSVIYSTYQKMFEGIDSYSIDSDLKTVDCGMLVFDFVFSGDTSNMEDIEESKESLNMLSGGNSMLNGHLIGGTSSKLLDIGCRKAGDEELSSHTTAEKVPSLFKSLYQFSDLELFLNPQKATGRANIEPAVKDIDNNAAIPWFHPVTKLHILQKNYLTILENNTELKKMLDLFLDADSYQLLRLPKERLMDCIKKPCSQRSPLAHGDESIMTLVTLYAIKQMAWYLCFYGIHTTHLYLDKLYQNLEYLKCRLSLLQSLIEDAHEKVDKEITRSHPSLSVIQGILQSNAATGNLKVLIVAEQVFWLSLKKLLTSMRISSNELQNFHMHKNHPDACESNEFTDGKIDDLLHSDCLIASQEHISASFPFNKFGIILEYGGSHVSSRISTISPKLAGLPCLYHLKMDLEDFSIPKALCEGFDMPQNVGITMEGVVRSSLFSPLSQYPPFSLKLPFKLPLYATLEVEGHCLRNKLCLVSFLLLTREAEETCFRQFCWEGEEGMIQSIGALHGHMNDQKSKNKVEDLVAVNEVDACCMPLPVSREQSIMEFLHSQPSMPSFPGTVIVVNTQNFDKEMLISRRSTYQRILAMEKEGTQVVERDSSLPVDVIISADICLVWYDCSNIGKKATTLDEASSCLPLCVEDIATNVLTLLSFTFSGCILVNA
ncbi:Protein shortage in CHIASMATA 1 [Vitis vinifera]|uniref:Protein shortage in CHIASMATA 1 n=1 Tax=Vitis vinifera TaxID=29760 RepID=A0A438CWX5_VITVI|nr:Protein shortage in CHIASMATA 1 [Vitis vinifera]